MSDSTQSLDPDTSDDPSVAMAIRERDWYQKASGRTNSANVASQVLLLLVGAGTTVAAGTGAPALVTACLAGFSFVLTGARSVFNWNRLAVSRTSALRELRVAIHRYQVIPISLRSEGDSLQLVECVHKIIEEEQGAWATFRRQDPSFPNEPSKPAIAELS